MNYRTLRRLAIDMIICITNVANAELVGNKWRANAQIDGATGRATPLLVVASSLCAKSNAWGQREC